MVGRRDLTEAIEYALHNFATGISDGFVMVIPWRAWCREDEARRRGLTKSRASRGRRYH